MKRNRKPSSEEVSKYKARMNVDGSQMIKGLHYEETYAPVVQYLSLLPPSLRTKISNRYTGNFHHKIQHIHPSALKNHISRSGVWGLRGTSGLVVG
jgi:hypothetical protein